MRFCWMMFLLGALCAEESNEEALFVRRIADFWEEGEYQIAKSQIEQFITQFPESAYSDPLCAALGDLYIREKNFLNAYNHYAKIQSSEFTNRVFLNRMQCLYEMQWYATLADECEAYLQNESHLHVTYFLAMALYHQCLNAAQEPELLQNLALRARPHFETLAQSELSSEIGQTYAHLSCMLKDYQKASAIYIDLAKLEGVNREEMLFQAALIQSESEKESALQTFHQIAEMGGERAKEAAYNRLVLNFELGRYDELIDEKILSELPPERIPMARLFLGRSLLNLNKHEEAIVQLKLFFEENKDTNTLRSASLTLLDASVQMSDLPTFDFALQKLKEIHPNDLELPKAYYSRAQLLKKEGRFDLAKQQFEQLLNQFPSFSQKGEALFELAFLEYKNQAWETCRQRASAFLSEFSDHSLVPFAWRYLLAASTELAKRDPLFRSQLMSDLNTFLETRCPPEEKGEWELLLAKTHYELGQFGEAEPILERLETPNALLLRSLVQRDAHKNLHQFIALAEKAIESGADLLDPAQIQTALFSACVELSLFDQGAEHLYQAFQANGEIKGENLLWLAEHSFARLEERPTNADLAEKTAQILLRCKAALQDFEETVSIVYRLAQVYLLQGRLDETIALLKNESFTSEKKDLLLGEALSKKGNRAEARELFEAIVAESATMRDPVAASASLQLARLKLQEKDPDFVAIATELKNLTLQKNLIGEPTYLEAALDYIDLQAEDPSAKRKALLEKTKRDFLERSDLLSNDYHEARLKYPQKNRVFEGYMKLIDAEISIAEGKIGEAKSILEPLMNEPCEPSLLERSRMLLLKYTHRDSKIGFGQGGPSDFLAGTRGSAKSTDRSEDEKYEEKPTSDKTNV